MYFHLKNSFEAVAASKLISSKITSMYPGRAKLFVLLPDFVDFRGCTAFIWWSLMCRDPSVINKGLMAFGGLFSIEAKTPLKTGYILYYAA